MSLVSRTQMTHQEPGSNPYDCNMGDAKPVFATLIVNARKAKGWSQDDLERESGVSRGTISRWERGATDLAFPAHVRAVCRALGIDPRQAAVALGYLTDDEIGTPVKPVVDPEVEMILAALADPALPRDQREQWKNYLLYLHEQARRKAV